MTKFVTVVYEETIDDYAVPQSIRVIGIFDNDATAEAAGKKYVSEYRFTNSYDVQEVEQ